MKTIIIAMLATGLMAQAQTSSTSVSSQSSGESSAKIQDLQKKDEQMKDIDQEITNNKMRAELGSKSRWSVRTSVVYNGGTIQKAFNEERPNITQGPNTQARARMAADLAVKYRTTDKTSLNFGTGVTVITPFHRTLDEATNSNTKSAPNGRNPKNASVSNPYLEFNYAGKLGVLQSFSQLSATYASESYDRNVIGLSNTASASTQMIYDVGNNSIGIAATYYYNIYKNSGNTYLDENGLAAGREDQGWYAVPYYEYAFNDKYNFRTVFNWFNFSRNRGESEFHQLKPQQSMGLGISVTRDIFLYPNVQFIPQDIRADRTNVALSANINVF